MIIILNEVLIQQAVKVLFLFTKHVNNYKLIAAQNILLFNCVISKASTRK